MAPEDQHFIASELLFCYGNDLLDLKFFVVEFESEWVRGAIFLEPG
ncbi:hypothetical protein DOT_2657 [Desulfosporosinus sp. OT]|nr:hypothetical protein DOT_2657 [Desulfosporosinus sp. OT]